jgi:hypothetical protein
VCPTCFWNSRDQASVAFKGERLASQIIYKQEQYLSFDNNYILETVNCNSIISGTIHVSVDYYGSSIASPQCFDTYVTMSQKMDQDEEKSYFEFLSFLVLYYIVVYK